MGIALWNAKFIYSVLSIQLDSADNVLCANRTDKNVFNGDGILRENRSIESINTGLGGLVQNNGNSLNHACNHFQYPLPSSRVE